MWDDLLCRNESYEMGNMGHLKKPVLAKLFMGMIFSELEVLNRAEEQLTGLYGDKDLSSEIIPFSSTDYYTKEMGENLFRKFISFKTPIEQDAIPAIKHVTNDLEQQYAKSPGERRINIDPGYLTAAKVVLATTKDYNHRLYLGQQIYGEVTLHFKSGKPQGFPWTYPDYLSEPYRQFFQKLRVIYMRQKHRL